MKTSRALHHFPRFTWRQGKRLLWNPIQKKALINRPEERVRLRLIDYLTREAGWPASRIGLEVSADRGNDEQKGRADIICYDRAFNPVLLAECKAENVNIDENTLLQAGSYNRDVKCEYVLITNGIRDILYKTSEPGNELDSLPVNWEVATHEQSVSGFDYWAERGFAGHNTNPQLRRFTGLALEKIFLRERSGDNPYEVSYLRPKVTSPDGPLDHYYRILHLPDDWKVALSMIATRHESTRLVMMLKKQDENIGLVEINPELHLKKVGPDTIIYLSDKTVPANIFEKSLLPLNSKNNIETHQLVEPVIEYFNQQRIAHV